VIDIKENYEQVLSKLLADLKGNESIFDQQKNPSAIKIVVSGEIPPPEKFDNYPSMIYFDGRPEKRLYAGTAQTYWDDQSGY
jgi:alkaline phosphatase